MVEERGTRNETRGARCEERVEFVRCVTFVRHVEAHEELGSTNDRAATLARNSQIELPALVVARRQTAGRGRGANVWWSAEGALTFSLVIAPEEFGVPVANWPQLSLTAAVAVADAVAKELHVGPPQSDTLGCSHVTGGGDARAAGDAAEHATRRVAIKWPNDVMLDDAKVCGILLESLAGAATANARLVIGVGINVNNSWRAAPHDLPPRGIALCDATGRSHNLSDVLIATLQQLEYRIGQLATQDAELRRIWRDRSWLTGHRVEVQASDSRIHGECAGIADDGALLVQTAAGVQRMVSGTVRRV